MYIDYGDLNEAEHVLDETNVALERGDVIEDSQEDINEDDSDDEYESPRERLASLPTRILAARATAQELP